MKLGCLERIELRDIWKTEDQDFTPWLAREDNISMLADTLGLELEVEAQEKEVGPFRADILCKDIRDDSWVLIENQLERTDHKHLGQLLTYAAGLKAVSIIWIAARFTDEHRAALDWLNEATAENFRFFALEVELWKIGESSAAPKFNIVSKPNEWSKTVGAARKQIESDALTETKQLQLSFWTALQAKLDSHPNLRPQQPRPQHWTNISIGRSGMRLGALINTREDRIGVELYLHDDNAQAYFHELEETKSDIEAALGFSPLWKALPEKRASRIVFYRQASPLDREDHWGEYLEWMVARLDDFDRVFRPRVKQLDPDKFVLGQDEASDD